MSNTFSYVKYDQQAIDLQAKFKAQFEEIEQSMAALKPGRAKALVLTNLEVAYMWTGKAIRDEQIERTGKVDEQPERSAE